MKSSLAAPRYAHAFFLMAIDRNQLESLEKDLVQIKKILSDNPKILHLFTHSTISHTEQEKIVDQVFAGLSKLTLDFIKVLIKKNRIREFPYIQEEFHRLYEKKMKIKDVVAISAMPLSKAIEDRLMSFLRIQFVSEVRLIKKVNAHILGGLILRVDDYEIDGSYKNHLTNMRQRLLASYEEN